MYSLSFYVPETDKERVKMAMFHAGAGKIGNYDQCCFEYSGTGQYRPLTGSNPYLGELNKLEYVTEYKVEMVVLDSVIKEVIEAMKKNHPYEEVAYHVVKCEEL
jgi:hypothetical protein